MYGLTVLVGLLPTLVISGGWDDGTRLAGLYENQISRRLNVPETEQRYYADLLAKQFAAVVDGARSQYVLLIDRNPLVQAGMIYWRDPDGNFHFIGASPVATGRPNEFDHFETPLGIFDHTVDSPDFRAEGTQNENGIRGYGSHGMRVYDFGWQNAMRGWGPKLNGQREQSPMRLQVHATDPDILEPRLGKPGSKGCIRIPASLNKFIDHYGLLDADYDEGIAAGKSYWVLWPTREPTPWPGRYLVIVDSQRTARPAWVK